MSFHPTAPAIFITPEYAYELTEAVRLAHEALVLTSHETTCRFSGCTCGAVEDFKTARLAFYRAYNKLQESRGVTP